MYLGGARLAEIYPVPPLLRNQVLSIGLTSYNGTVYYGINADREAMPDADMLPLLITEALDELLRLRSNAHAGLHPGDAVDAARPGGRR